VRAPNKPRQYAQSRSGLRAQPFLALIPCRSVATFHFLDELPAQFLTRKRWEIGNDQIRLDLLHNCQVTGAITVDGDLVVFLLQQVTEERQD
jgi:hypothetical protein